MIEIEVNLKNRTNATPVVDLNVNLLKDLPDNIFVS